MKKTIYSLLTMALAVFAFTSCEDVPAPFDFPSKGGEVPGATVEPAGSGTVADPYNVAAAIKYTQSLEPGAESPSNIYIKGIISSIKDDGYTLDNYGNGTFWISDDGSNKNQFYIYRALYLNNKKYTSNDKQIEVGDTVIICGIVTNYQGQTPETAQNKAYLYALNGVTSSGGGSSTGEAKGSGTVDDPYNPAGAADAVKNLKWTSNDDYETTGDVYVKGKISRIADKGTFTEGGTYGNASFYISEDGTQNGEFYCFRILYLGNKKFESGKTDIKVGDEVIICGQLMNYRGNTPETVAGKAYLYSLNGKTDGGGGGGGGETGEVKAVTIADFNAAAVSNDVWYKLSGTVKNLKDGDEYGNFDLEDATGSVYVYGLLSEKGGEKKKFQELAAAKGIKNGTKITIIGNRGDYNGKIEVLNAYLVSVDGQGGGGGDDPNPTGKGSYSDPYSVSAAIAAGSGSGVYVKGYIVGCVSGQAYDSGATFNALPDVVTNLLIAESSTENDPSKCMPVQLPSGDVRKGLNLVDNPSNLGKEVLLYGNIEAYFRVPGVKSVTYAEIDGKTIGTKSNVRRKAIRKR
jgi:hypothetical protein